MNTVDTHKNRDSDNISEPKRLSDAEMVGRYWQLLPLHIRRAIDETGAEEARSFEMRFGGFGLDTLSNKQILARAAFSRVLRDLKSLGELPEELKPNIRKELEEKAMTNRAQMLRGCDIMTLVKNNSLYPGIDIILGVDAEKKIKKALKGTTPELAIVSAFSSVTSRLSLPRGAYNVTLGGVQIYGDYEGEWKGNQHYYGTHYDKETGEYFEAKGCSDCDRGPDLRNAKPLVSLQHMEVAAIHGHQPPPAPEKYVRRDPVFYQNPNYYPDGTIKGGGRIPVFYERLGG